MPTYGFVWTLNNYTDEDIIRINGAIGQRGISYICYGREVAPSTGTPHLQGYMQSTQKQYERLQLAFAPTHLNNLQQAKAASGPNAAEISGVFGEPYTAIGYCMKDGDFYETGEKVAIAPSKQGGRNDLKKAMEAVKSGATDLQLFEEHSSVMARYDKFVARYRTLIRNETGKAALRAEFAAMQLYPWQTDLLDTFVGTSDRRIIHWYWSTGGNVGKSTFGTYLAVMHDALIIETGKKNDINYIFSKNPAKIVVIDIVRATGEGEINHMYGIGESLKNGRLMVSKYESDTIFFEPPHILFLANFAPDRTKWSEDRLVEMKLD